MDGKSIARKVARKRPPRAKRAAHGQWLEPAKVVYDLVTNKEWNVSDAVRDVVNAAGFKDKDTAFNGVRAAYYVLRKRSGPAPKPVEEEDDFEI